MRLLAAEENVCFGMGDNSNGAQVVCFLTRKVRKPKARWVEPTLLAEAEYRDTTADGLLLQSAFKGLHET